MRLSLHCEGRRGRGALAEQFAGQFAGQCAGGAVGRCKTRAQCNGLAGQIAGNAEELHCRKRRARGGLAGQPGGGMTRRRCKTKAQRGGILPVVLVLLSLAALMAVAGLERSADQRLLAGGADERGRLHEAAMTALAAGVADARARHADDFSAGKAGLFSGARDGRRRDYPWKDKDNTAGFIIEQLARGPALRAGEKTVAQCRLLVTARAQIDGGHALFAQALVSAPLEAAAVTGAAVVAMPPVTLDAVRVITP